MNCTNSIHKLIQLCTIQSSPPHFFIIMFGIKFVFAAVALVCLVSAAPDYSPYDAVDVRDTMPLQEESVVVENQVIFG